MVKKQNCIEAHNSSAISKSPELKALMSVMMESTVVQGEDVDTSVNLDGELWRNLGHGIPDMIYEKLPLLERLRLRVVCKDWNRIALKRVERRPYFVIIVESVTCCNTQYLFGLSQYNVVFKSLSFKRLPFKRKQNKFDHFAPFAAEGLIFSKHHVDEWCVYNIHTRTRHVLPRPPGLSSRRRTLFCGMMVDTSRKPHTFKLVMSNPFDSKMQIYDSASHSWSSTPNPSSLLQHAGYGNWYFCMCHKGCMYMSTRKAVDGLSVYSLEEDQWSTLSGLPFRGEKRPYLGAWDDRIFAVLHDAEAESVIVWELIDTREQKWVEYACCSEAQYNQLMVHDRDSEPGNEMSIVSVFCEEYVLMCNWQKLFGILMLNLKTREWEPIIL